MRERERGTIEQLIVTPIRSWELLVGKLAPYVLLAFIDTIEILVLGVLLFHVPDQRVRAAAAGVLRAVPGDAAGRRAAHLDVAKTQQEAILVSLFFLLPNIFLSGLLLPDRRDAASGCRRSRTCSRCATSSRSCAGSSSRAPGTGELLVDIVAIAVYGLIVMTIATRRFHKRLD